VMNVNGGIRQVEERGYIDEGVQERIETGASPPYDQAWSREHNDTRHVAQRWQGHRGSSRIFVDPRSPRPDPHIFGSTSRVERCQRAMWWCRGPMTEHEPRIFDLLIIGSTDLRIHRSPIHGPSSTLTKDFVVTS
jgi:hypothetical protein